MKVQLINGSPHQRGCIHTILEQAARCFASQGIKTEEFWVGKSPISGCLDCKACKKNHTCIITDNVNQFSAKAANADAFIFASPVHYAGASGSLTSFMDRLFYSNPRIFYGKPAAAIVNCRRDGAASAFDQINKYFGISNMFTVGSQYWNQVHGLTPDEVLTDEEGIQTIRTLCSNMAWLMQCIEAGAALGISAPEYEVPLRTNFIR
ncbi:Multimeric flavodoxin WrbA [Eubacterium aggregans]|uniref:Multimeric flavodoxin WrbA n=1 Tax=Eubacterium aggregans TaxID=81409 RepID=A0A1H3WT13_9FIRM|nr:flavodoxin family protein [Eubacterium aggregans]SDZ90297.1 Multimeric flavodoxin WrbA [Eubacterium aggregans]